MSNDGNLRNFKNARQREREASLGQPSRVPPSELPAREQKRSAARPDHQAAARRKSGHPS